MEKFILKTGRRFNLDYYWVGRIIPELGREQRNDYRILLLCAYQLFVLCNVIVLITLV